MFIRVRCQYSNIQSSEVLTFHTHDQKGYYSTSVGQSFGDVTLKTRNNTPSTFSKIYKGSMTFGYGNKTEGEFLAITINQAGSLYIERDIRATLPLYYGYIDGFFILSDDYAEVIEAMPRLSIRYSDLVRAVAPLPGQRMTLWNEVFVLGSNETLSIEKGRQPVKGVLKKRSWQTSVDLTPSDPEEFIPRLDDVLEKVVDTYIIDEKFTPAFEISGGLDSSTLPLYISRDIDKDMAWNGVSLFYSGMRAVTQAKKVEENMRRAPKARLTSIKADDVSGYIEDYFHAQNPRPFLANRHPFASLSYEVAMKLEDLGSKVVFNGNGGDELFEHTACIEEQLGVGTKWMDRIKEQIPPFFTYDFFQVAQEVTSQKPAAEFLPLISPTLTSNEITLYPYIDHGIWPVSPFMNADLYEYCQALPWKYRYDKHILRAYYQAKGFPPAIYKKVFVNEAQEGEIDQAMLTESFARIVLLCAENSVLHELGFVDKVQLIEYFSEVYSGVSKSNLFFLQRWLAVEMNLQLALKSGQLKL